MRRWPRRTSQRQQQHAQRTAIMPTPRGKEHGNQFQREFTLRTLPVIAVLSLPSNLRRPPSRPHQQEPPILNELRRLAFNRMPDKLQRPSKTEQPQPHPQQSVPHNPRHQHRQRHHNDRYPKRMCQPVQRMLMALRILRNPAIPTPSTKHGRHTTPTNSPSQPHNPSASPRIAHRATKPMLPQAAFPGSFSSNH